MSWHGGGEAGVEVAVPGGVPFSVKGAAGASVLLGPNGCGKTTLLQALALYCERNGSLWGSVQCRAQVPITLSDWDRRPSWSCLAREDLVSVLASDLTVHEERAVVAMESYGSAAALGLLDGGSVRWTLGAWPGRGAGLEALGDCAVVAAAAATGPDIPSIVLFDDFGDSLGPAEAQRAAWLVRRCVGRGTQVFLATHSRDVVEALAKAFEDLQGELCALFVGPRHGAVRCLPGEDYARRVLEHGDDLR